MMSRKLIYILSVLTIIISISSCDSNNALSQNKMVAVLHDIQIAEAIQQTRRNDFTDMQSKDALIEGVLRKHGITQAQLDSSLVWYSDNVEVYLRVNDSVMATLRRDVDIQNEMVARRSYRRNNINFSLLPEFYYLTNSEPTLPFFIDSLQVGHFPDFEIKLKAMSIEEDVDANFSVSFVYNDTTLIANQKITSDGLYQIEKPNRAGLLKGIYGNVHLNTENMREDRKVLLYDISIRDMIKEEKVDSLQTTT